MADYQSLDNIIYSTECEVCKRKNIKTIALKFCKDCLEYLCNDCASKHEASKATQSHTIVDVNDKSDIAKQNCVSESKKCEPCEATGQDSDALRYCEECEELLCGDCTSSHKVSKATRKHTPIGIDEMKPEDCKNCEPCQYKDLRIKALKFCNDCEEMLCETCSNSHCFQKATKHHTQINIKDMKTIKRRTCDLCKSLDKYEVAVLYCNDCEEAFCKLCATTHMAQKATRSHKLIDVRDMKKEKEILCEPCQASGKSVPAFKYCGECEELLCENCTKFHRRQKATKLHELKNPTDNCVNSEDDKLCDNCKLDNKNVSAVMFCCECEEYYCNMCTKSHKTMKATRTHKLIDSKENESIEINMCDQCLIDKQNKKAEYFCNDCEEFYCDKCHTSHKRVKTSRFHVTVSEKEARKKLNTDCDACKFNNQDVRAYFFCQDCHEFLCKTCSEEHKQQRLTRDHLLITATEGSKMTSTVPQILCEPCKEVDTNKPATSFCQDCREPMCENCSLKHTRQKPTRKHKISNDLNLFRELLSSPEQEKEKSDLKR